MMPISCIQTQIIILKQQKILLDVKRDAHFLF